MTASICHLPAGLAQDLEQYALDVDRFRKGDLSASILKSRRVPRGIYEQRRNGTYMVRVRVPGGAISAAQVRALAEVASRYETGTLHATTRQDFQIHDVALEQTPALLRDLLRAGLTSKGGGGNTVRNVTACPYAGICPAERFDVTPFATAVTEHLIGLPGSFNLPRKYKVAFSGCSADCALAQVNDLGFIAHMRDGNPGFSVYVGGGLGAESRVGDCLEHWVPAGEVIRLAEAVRRLFDRLGDRRNRRRARLRFVVEKAGIETFRGWLHEAVRAVTDEGTPACTIQPELAETPAEPPADYRALLTQAAGLDILRQRQPGFAAVPLRLPLGQVSRQTLEALGGLAERFSEEKMLRVTQDQNLLLRFVREPELSALHAELERVLGPDAGRPTALQAFTTCTGAATCRLGLCLSRNAARACADALAGSGLSPATLLTADIRMNGCPNACGQHPVGAIGLFGAALRKGDRLVPAYRVLLGARRSEGRARLGESVGTIPARALPAFLVDLLREFEAARRPGEALTELFDRQGLDHFKPILERHATPPDHADAPEFYRDWEQDEDFSLAGRGPGECGAGVFEVIAEDLAAAAKTLEQAEKDAASGEALFQGLLATARALLITRGVDSQDPDIILRSFETHFLDTGLVAADFRGLLTKAHGYREGWRDALAGRREEIRRLLDRVEHLYATMDADLRFQAPEATPANAPVAGNGETAGVSGTPATAELDLRGVACPMNFVKAKLRLETMEVGATLAMLLDDGQPAQNVPASFQQEGQEIADFCATGDGHWRVVVRKTKG
jgi:sulfite reductase (ferredoxin)